MKRVYKQVERTPEDLARIEAAREKFDRERPTLEQLVSSGDCEPPMPHAVFLSLGLATAERRATISATRPEGRVYTPKPGEEGFRLCTGKRTVVNREGAPKRAGESAE